MKVKVRIKKLIHKKSILVETAKFKQYKKCILFQIYRIYPFRKVFDFA